MRVSPGNSPSGKPSSPTRFLERVVFLVERPAGSIVWFLCANKRFEEGEQK
jgi:hypothetical protein